ncbi:TetR/AcrR family transcriptional regulator [Vibrio maritimus]|uniref:TetR/AcrR family transcriptional regulator n=1 Tax=Vibrio maritimus TaxID=990268 RepID=UPI001F48EBFC|nr:TetR/AcrR family transcriptional regulator [Vibrio maritimus]
MARISAEERAKKKLILDGLVLSIFLEEGWGAVTYDRLAKEFGVSKSSIQNYYPSSIMFATALQGKVLPMVLPLLNFSSEEKFVSSWICAYEDEQHHVFREVVEMLIDNILKDGTSPYSRGGALKLEEMLAKNTDESSAKRAMKTVFGEVIYRKMFS